MLCIRPLLKTDQENLWTWLHHSLWDPPPAPLRAREVLERPEVRLYAEQWGREGDVGVVAEVDDSDVGGCWMRLHKGGAGLAYIDDETPQLGIALLPAYRRQGYGQTLLMTALHMAREAGYRQVSLTVHPANPAKVLYERSGFEAIGDRNGYALMLARLEPLGHPAPQPGNVLPDVVRH
jgi:ribosomal protein S18 acetylase RimI-like enzyme